MLRLLSFPLKEPRTIQTLRRKAEAAPSDADAQVVLALALNRTGCTYEATSILRPLRAHWKASKDAPLATEAVAAQSWWNKNWRQFARLRHAGKKDAALALLGDRAVQYWDLPPLLMHLADMAVDDEHLDLASHLFQRVFDLSRRGLPNMDMAAFAYVSQSGLVDVLCRSGEPTAALAQHRAITPNPGNAMGHEIQHVRLLVAAGHLDEAMRAAAALIVTASKHRTGYSKDMRMDFIKSSPELAPLRKRPDWKALLRDPEAYLRGSWE
jgi:hypothetical protein